MASLAKQVDKKLQSNKDLRGFVVLLTEDAEEAEEGLKELAKKHKIKKLPLTVYEAEAGPPSYKIAKDADVTVHLWKGAVVKVNHAFAEGELNKKSVKKVVDSIAKITD